MNDLTNNYCQPEDSFTIFCGRSYGCDWHYQPNQDCKAHEWWLAAVQAYRAAGYSIDVSIRVGNVEVHMFDGGSYTVETSV